MKYLEPYKLFILKKLLIECNDSPKPFNVRDFWYEKENWKHILDYLNELTLPRSISLKEDPGDSMIIISNIALGKDFFESNLSGLLDADADEDGLVGAAINKQRLESGNYLGLGRELYNKAEQEIADGSFNRFIFRPYFSLSFSDLDTIDLHSAGLPYSTAIFNNLTFFISLTPNQRKYLNDYLDKYLTQFRNDGLDRTQAEDFYTAKKQEDILTGFIDHIENDYPIKNLFLNNDKIAQYYKGSYKSIDINKFRLIETALLLEKYIYKNTKQPVYRVEKMDYETGVSITKVGRDKTPPILKVVELIQSQFSSGKKFVWHCKVCGKAILETNNIEDIKNWIKQYSESNPLSCSITSAHKNWISIRDEKIIMTGFANADNSGFYKKI